jgi:GH25 family lysozyme M1 (1,4-beta-N-acetylmuramidase)
MSITKITLCEGQSIKLSSTDKNASITLESSNTNVATISDNATVNGKSAGDATITVKATGYAENSIALKVVAKGTTLKDKNGNVLYVLKSDGTYREATYEDYYSGAKLYKRKAATTYRYTGWQTIGGKTYFYDKNGNYVTGEQVIQGAKYTFGSDGALQAGQGTMGIDVSKWNGNIDWKAVKNSGVSFVIIRCGYRGSSQGALIEDPKFRANIQGAQNAGIRVGVYFFTQAVNEVEAVEEASMVINLIKGYNISYPVYLDVEASHGRGDNISAAQRTANIKAFCGTIQNAGYKAGVYANKTWFTSYINTSQITNYRIWLAQYAKAVTYNGSRYDMWQYSSKGRVTGISGNVDMNICY